MQNPDGTANTYVYSADGKRQKQITAAGTVDFVRDGENVLLETDANLITQAQYTQAPGEAGKYSLRRSGASRFYLPDFQGNTRALTDGTQAVTDTLLTDAWGAEILKTGSTVNPFEAFGQWGYYRDTASRLYVRARHLRTDLGRWMSRDPAGRRAADIYPYVRNRPAAVFDPRGLAGIEASGPYVGCCGANVTAWLGGRFGELARQTVVSRLFYDVVIRAGDRRQIPFGIDWCTSPCPVLEDRFELLNYAGWANMNQGYKNLQYFLSRSTHCPVPRGDGSGHCSNTVTLCRSGCFTGVCLSLDQLGNIMYGWAGRSLHYGLFDLTLIIACIKAWCPPWRPGEECEAKLDAIRLGYFINLITGGSTDGAAFCVPFRRLLPYFPLAIDDCDPYRSYCDCRLCDEPPTHPKSGVWPDNECLECWDRKGGPYWGPGCPYIDPATAPC